VGVEAVLGVLLQEFFVVYDRILSIFYRIFGLSRVEQLIKASEARIGLRDIWLVFVLLVELHEGGFVNNLVIDLMH